MTSQFEIEINVSRAYIRGIREQFPRGTYESDKFVLILQIYQLQLKMKHEQKAATPDQLATLKNGVRQAEYFINHIIGQSPEWAASEIHEILCAIVVELTKTIIANENLYPELKHVFDRERERYRKMKSDSEEALEP